MFGQKRDGVTRGWENAYEYKEHYDFYFSPDIVKDVEIDGACNTLSKQNT
jgi:hypothetical protein